MENLLFGLQRELCSTGYLADVPPIVGGYLLLEQVFPRLPRRETPLVRNQLSVPKTSAVYQCIALRPQEAKKT